MARADWVVSAAPLTEATRGMFDARRFGLMQPSARFINVGRGQLVVEDALVEAVSQAVDRGRGARRLRARTAGSATARCGTSPG